MNQKTGLLVALCLVNCVSSSFAEEPAQHHQNGSDMQMIGALGRYSMLREASGTSWQPGRASYHGGD